MARTLLIATVVLIVLATLMAGFTGFYGLWLAVPVGLAVAVVVARHRQPVQGAALGAALTFSVIVAVVVPQLVVKAIAGGFDNTDYCDGFCFTNGEGFLFASYIMLFIALPAALAGGLISLVASVVSARLAPGA
jgi:hypothetical protein